MEVKEAIAIAKEHAAELFAGEGIHNIGLEEIEFDARSKQWVVTIGFSRSWDAKGALAEVSGVPRARSYKVVRVANESGKVVSVSSQKSLV